MSSACSITNLTPEQRAAGKRVVIVLLVVHGLEVVSLLALMMFLTSAHEYRPRVAAIWGVSTIAVDRVATRLCMARLKQIETGQWPRKSCASWLWDFVLVVLLTTILTIN